MRKLFEDCVKEVPVAYPCPVCSVMPVIVDGPNWKLVCCEKCGFGVSEHLGSMEDTIRKYNELVEETRNAHQ